MIKKITILFQHWYDYQRNQQFDCKNSEGIISKSIIVLIIGFGFEEELQLMEQDEEAEQPKRNWITTKLNKHLYRRRA